MLDERNQETLRLLLASPEDLDPRDEEGQIAELFDSLEDDPETLSKVLNAYIDIAKNVFLSWKNSRRGMFTYRPGMDLPVSPYLLVQCGVYLTRGIPGYMEKNEELSKEFLSQGLRRLHDEHSDLWWQMPELIAYVPFLIEEAYPDEWDHFLQSLFDVAWMLGEGYEEIHQDVPLALRCYEKVSEMDISGRQIVWPFYLQGRAQAYLGRIYVRGLGTPKDVDLGRHYLDLAAENLGREYLPDHGDLFYDEGQFFLAYVAYSCFNPHYRYEDHMTMECDSKQLARQEEILEMARRGELSEEENNLILGHEAYGQTRYEEAEEYWAKVGPDYEDELDILRREIDWEY